VRYGETIAVGNGRYPSFVRYKERTFGINLGWSDSPSIRVEAAGRAGEPSGELG
jgi:hypothetical protein